MDLRGVPVTVGIPLDDDHVAAVCGIRRRLGTPRVSRPSSPHISLLVLLDAPDQHAIDEAVRSVAARTARFAVRARGFGVFDDGDGPPVLHVPVVRSTELARLQGDTYETMAALGAKIDGHYAPTSWLPHVTLWDRVPTVDKLAAAVVELAAGPPIAWSVPVSCLATMGHAKIGPPVPLGRRCAHR